MATSVRAADIPLSRPQETPAEAAKTPVVKIWAGLGAVILAFDAYLLIRWVTGPYFHKVSNTVSEPPSWMKAELLAWEVLSIPVALFLIWHFVARPWIRERRIGVDGMLVIGAASMWVQDPWSSAGQHWFVYNTWMVNMGSWVHAIPWWTSFGKPGAMTSEPILFTPAAYVYIFLLAAALGCLVMRQIKRRYPTISAPALVACCFLFMCVFDILLEGIIWLPLGVFEYPGGHWGLFASTYHKYPLQEMFTIAAVFTAVTSLRYFVDDRGRTIVERGVDEVRGGRGRQVVLRALAVTAALQVAMFLGYNVPNTFFGTDSTAWPTDLQKRSYFTNNLCGMGTDRFCPGPGNPNIREKSIYPNTGGKVTVPKGTEVPKLVPFDKGKPGPQDG
jgi:hypothetical protein